MKRIFLKDVLVPNSIDTIDSTNFMRHLKLRTYLASLRNPLKSSEVAVTPSLCRSHVVLCPLILQTLAGNAGAWRHSISPLTTLEV